MVSKTSIRGLVSLVLTSALWGTSFPVIKILMYSVHEYTYTWLRSLAASLTLLPYVVYTAYRSRVDPCVVKGGFLAGTAYALGLWLQGWGTRYTTASSSAFITGLNVVFVHLYTGVFLGKYSLRLALSLVSAVTGLYLFTKPSTGFNVGDFLVLLSAFMWALQVIVVDKYSARSNPLIFTYFEMIPAAAFIVPDYYRGIVVPSARDLLLIAYLGVVCSVAAFTLQVYGQKYIEPSHASIIYLFEPVFASLFAYMVLGEVLKQPQFLGATLILLSMFISSTSREVYKNTVQE